MQLAFVGTQAVIVEMQVAFVGTQAAFQECDVQNWKMNPG
jgi:hypothetical protein